MANTKNCKNGSVQNADTVVCDILKNIKNQKLTAESLFNSEETKQKSKTAAKKYKLCCLQKAEESHHLYQNILTCVVMENSKRVELIETDIVEYISFDGQIASLIQESSKLLKEFKTSTEATNNAACALANCVKNKAPQLFPKNGKGKGDTTKGGQEELEYILETAKQLDKKAQNAFESMVTLAGIQTFGSTKNLTQYIEQISECMNSFKTMIESNVTTTYDEVGEIRTSMNEIMQELAVVTTTKYGHATTFTGLESVRKFICHYDCKDGFIDICGDCDPCDDDQRDEGKSPKQRSSELQSDDQD